MTDQTKSMLVIDDEDSICLAFERFFKARDWNTSSSASAGEGLSDYDELRPDVVFLDVRLPDRSGLDLLDDLSERGAAVVIITACGDLDTVVRALRGKACDYLTKPIDLDKAFALAKRISETKNRGTEKQAPLPSGGEILLGNSPAMQEAYKLIARAAGTRSPVLVQGETGTGKELAALAIHRFGSRRNGPFLAINCGAIPEQLIESEMFGHVKGAFTGADCDRAGKFESTDGGTLLLDEIGELPMSVQVKLLRVLDSGTIERVGSSKTIRPDVRIIAATNKLLEEQVQFGKFRQDLFYRLAVLQISMPPLRDRGQDIPLLAKHFLRQFALNSNDRQKTLASDARDVLMRYAWPGNVRELKNAIDHAVTVAPDRTIRQCDLPQSVRKCASTVSQGDGSLEKAVTDYASTLTDGEPERYRRTIGRAERALIVQAMKLHNGNQSGAADYLGLHRNTLRKKLRELQIQQ